MKKELLALLDVIEAAEIVLRARRTNTPPTMVERIRLASISPVFAFALGPRRFLPKRPRAEA